MRKVIERTIDIKRNQICWLRAIVIVGVVVLGQANLLLAVPISSTLPNWTGDTITGVLNFGGGGAANFFDPANSYVPPGSSGIQPNAVVVDPDGAFVEFMYQNGYSGIDVDVDATSLLVTQSPVGIDWGTNSWDIYINGFDPDIANVTLVSNTMSGFTWSLVNSDTLHFSHVHDNVGPAMGQALFNLTPIPEPATVLLVGLGGLALVRKRRA